MYSLLAFVLFCLSIFQRKVVGFAHLSKPRFSSAATTFFRRNGFFKRGVSSSAEVLRLDTVDYGGLKSAAASEMPSQRENSTSSWQPIEDTARLDLRSSMPWSKTQEWALRDNLPKYTLAISQGQGYNQGLEKYVLWRSLLQDVVELSGYPIDFLQEQLSNLISNGEISLDKVPGVLPYLDDYCFEPSGGLSGRVYGVAGVADGSMIETTAVGQVEVTLSKGYIRTKEGSVAYELGKPLETVDSVYSGLAQEGTRTIQKFGKAASKSLSQSQVARSQEDDATEMLVGLGLSTGLLLTGAVAMNMLSHHLTVNVFWV